MKNTYRLLLGVLSSLLLAVGFGSAANRLDPISNEIPTAAGPTLRVAEECSSVCANISDLAEECSSVCADISDLA